MKDIPVFFETFHVGGLEIGKDGSPSFRHDDDFHRRLSKPVQDALAATGKTEGVTQEAVGELAAKIA